VEKIWIYINNLSRTNLGIITVLVLVVVSYILSQGIFLSFRKRVVRVIPEAIPDELIEIILDMFRMLSPFIIVLLFTPILTLPPDILKPFNHILFIALTILLTTLAVRFVIIGSNLLLKGYDTSTKDNLKARKIHTQIGVVQKIIIFVIVLLSISIIFLSFEQIRRIGISILASAGVIGLVVGLAAQKTLSTIIAGIQIALTQPIRLDDVVIVEDEWGWIEEITLTYVVVRIWDLRRLVLPVSYFMEKPFQNWTRNSSDILGTIYLYTDYQVSIDQLRDELKKVVSVSPFWDGKVCSLQVTEFKEHSVEVRALISAEDSSKAWDLRCYVREELLRFMQDKYPEAIARVRLEIDPEKK